MELAVLPSGGWRMKALSLRWLSLFLGGSAVMSAVAVALQQLPAVVPLGQVRLAWVVTRVLVEF